jgi:ElaA protein
VSPSPRPPIPVRFTCRTFAELTTVELYDALALRAAVFVVEQDCPYLDPDGLDPRAWHLLGRQQGVLVTYARWFEDGAAMRLGRMVVAPERRGSGLGLLTLEEALRRIGPRTVVAHAQDHLRTFYGAAGFVAEGSVFLEDGIPHVLMRRSS